MEQKEGGFNIEDEEIFYEHTNSSPEDEEFDAIVSALEEILQDDSFQSELSSFYQNNCDKFEESKENKLEYTEVFNQYTTLVESYLENYLSSKIAGFDMKRFERLMSERQDSLSGEAFDLLSSLGDFLEFKDTMVAQKSMKTESSAKISTTSAKPTSQSKRSEGMLDLCVSGHHV
mmetsp:Transcript_87725/g.171569  ORF Transcript_87725/g.171569 Transcript_87725/m.171569 type:complete len:175 (+) Transcript_87725:149-673(+)